jgi:hypothetical protein
MDDKDKDTPRSLSARALTTADIAPQKYTSYFAIVHENDDYNCLFHPIFLQHHKKLKPYDVIRYVHPAGHFDVYVTVRAVVAGGVTVDFHGGRPPQGIDPYKVAEDELAAAMKIRVCPIDKDLKPVIRVEFIPRTKWRVIGLSNQEVARDIPTKLEAEIEMGRYLNDVRMRLPTPEELMAEMQLRQALDGPQSPAPEQPKAPLPPTKPSAPEQPTV